MPPPHTAADGPDDPGFRVKFETHCIGGDTFHIRSLLDRQQFSDPDGRAERAGFSSATWPLFGVVWPAALELAETLRRLPLAGKRILEVGCGLALPSLVAHRRGADITASDSHPLAAGFLLENLGLNRMAPLEFAAENWAEVHSALGTFDLIVGSDILYERDQPGILSQYIHRHSKPHVEVIIIDPNRGNRARFTREMAALGYAHSESRPVARAPDQAPFNGRILSYRRNTTSR